MRQFSRRRQRGITTKRIIEETVGRDAAKENVKMERDESERVRVYTYVCTYVSKEDGCRRFARIGSAILQRKPLASSQRRVSLRIGIRCSTPGYQQECFPHSASCAFISSSATRSIPLPPPFSIHGYLPA